MSRAPSLDGRGTIPLPLPEGTCVCLACSWRALGREATAEGSVHTKATGHPTLSASATSTAAVTADCACEFPAAA